MDALTLFKYEGLGNDFLVLIDPERSSDFDAHLARALCDRHLGPGADGLMRLSHSRHEGDFLMELRNADGSIAETSGNGLRCAVLCALHEGMVDRHDVLVETIVGMSRAHVLTEDPPGEAEIRIEMGQATIERLPEYDLATRTAYGVNIGNPHLVLLAEVPDGLSIAAIGPDLELAVAGGQNVELATRGVDRHSIVVDTWERGAGLTLACGSGSSASAAAARLAGLVGDRVEVHNPGGAVVVDLVGPDHSPSVILTGATRKIATITLSSFDIDSLFRATGPHA